LLQDKTGVGDAQWLISLASPSGWKFEEVSLSEHVPVAAYHLKVEALFFHLQLSPVLLSLG